MFSEVDFLHARRKSDRGNLRTLIKNVCADVCAVLGNYQLLGDDFGLSERFIPEIFDIFRQNKVFYVGYRVTKRLVAENSETFGKIYGSEFTTREGFFADFRDVIRKNKTFERGISDFLQRQLSNALSPTVLIDAGSVISVIDEFIKALEAIPSNPSQISIVFIVLLP